MKQAPSLFNSNSINHEEHEMHEANNNFQLTIAARKIRGLVLCHALNDGLGATAASCAAVHVKEHCCNPYGQDYAAVAPLK
jgi:hypothetical protein